MEEVEIDIMRITETKRKRNGLQVLREVLSNGERKNEQNKVKEAMDKNYFM